jgi:proline iminopeptidase
MRRGRHTVSVDGTTLVFHVEGSGPVVVVHPGGPGSAWGYLRMEQAEREATLVYLEPVGTGASGRLAEAAEYSLATYVNGVEAVRQALGVERVVLLGHSHGGWVAQAYALAHPDHLAGLVLYATTPTTTAEWGADVAARMESFAGEPWYAEAAAPRDAAATDDEATAHFRQLAPFYFFDWTRRHAEFAPRIAEARVSALPGVAFDAADPIDFRPRLGEVSSPTLVLVGERDFVCSPRWSEELARRIAGARLVRFAQSGHMPHLEEPEAFARAVVEFAHEGTLRHP